MQLIGKMRAIEKRRLGSWFGGDYEGHQTSDAFSRAVLTFFTTKDKKVTKKPAQHVTMFFYAYPCRSSCRLSVVTSVSAATASPFPVQLHRGRGVCAA